MRLAHDGVPLRMPAGGVYAGPFDFATLRLGQSGLTMSVEIDELCLFDRVLSEDEVMFLAGRNGRIPFAPPKP